MESIWSKDTKISPRPSLMEDIKTETVVIGGGLAGCLIAMRLEEMGIPAVVLEAAQIGSGQTKNTTAKITSQHGLIYDKLQQSFGRERAKQYADYNQAAIAAYRNLIAKRQIDCQWEERDAYLYSRTEQEPLKREMEAARQAGIDASFHETTALPFSVKGAVRFGGQAQFHPLQFLDAITKDLTIYENTRVQTVEDNQVITPKGTVTAEHIVFATHFPFINVPGYYFMRMHQERSYVLALSEAPQLHGMYLGIDENEGYSFRNAGDLLLLGGGKHRTGENRKGDSYDDLLRRAVQWFPAGREVARWSAQDCMTLDGVPYIGPFSADASARWYVATGFQKWGMTSSMVSAMILSQWIATGDCPNADVFSPKRFTPVASAKSFLQEGAHAVKDLTKRIFAPPRATLDALPLGHGGVVEVDGEKVGAYKDETGNIFLVSVRCPHLGCQLEWNPAEKSWDCPCHGSRFDFHGKLLDGPAEGDADHA